MSDETERFHNFDTNQFAGGVNANIPSASDKRNQQWDKPSGKGSANDTAKEMLTARGALAECWPTRISSSIELETSGKKPKRKSGGKK